MNNTECKELIFIDLQWFAAEDEGRTEDPTEYKIRKAREEGRVAKSQEFIGALTLLLPSLTILFLGSYLFRTLVEMVQFYITRLNDLDPAEDMIIVGSFFTYFAKAAFPIAGIAMLSGVFANLVQTGPLFTTKPLEPDFSKIVPRFGKFFQRTMFSMEGLFNFAKSVLKMAVIGVVAYIIIRSKIEMLMNLQTMTLWSSIQLISTLTMQLLIISALLLLALSIPDMLFQRWQHREQLKMTKQEVKEERKMYEGDPLIKSRLRQRMRELMTRNMVANVPKADVVVTNPTHFAVALEWNHDTMPAPMVTAKGADEVAFRIRKIATDSGVPLVENRPLARALFAETEVGDIIPETYYQAMAAVLAHVHSINEERRRKMASGE
ncbi:MAG: flagellar biosynthesis protein FlhB [Treponema sp.]|jgi:flagellar biosynthetic protein FlhB|nr:flagellar biosynthesis protein FlhB [Treponema sp.]